MGIAWRGSLTFKLKNPIQLIPLFQEGHTSSSFVSLSPPSSHPPPQTQGARTPPRDFLTGVLLGLSTLGSLISCEAKSTGGALFVANIHTDCWCLVLNILNQ